MISDLESLPEPIGPKPLKGVGIVIAGEQPDKSHKALGIVFAQNSEALEELIRTLHASKLTVQRANFRPGTIILERPAP